MGNSSSTADDPALANNPNYDVPVYENSPSAVKLQPENKVEERDLPPSAGAAAPAQTTPYMQRRAAAGAAHPAAAPVTAAAPQNPAPAPLQTAPAARNFKERGFIVD